MFWLMVDRFAADGGQGHVLDLEHFLGIGVDWEKEIPAHRLAQITGRLFSYSNCLYEATGHSPHVF